MKRIVFIIAVVALGLITVTACGQKKEKKNMTENKTLVAYFSATGTTESLAKKIATATGGELYKITPETREIAMELMDALCIVVVFRTVNSILSKGVLRGGGDTRFLLVADMSTMWLVAVPLGALAGLTLKLPPFFTYLFLYSDQILKAFWCFLRLRSGKWIKHVQGTADFGEIEEDEEEIR